MPNRPGNPDGRFPGRLRQNGRGTRSWEARLSGLRAERVGTDALINEGHLVNIGAGDTLL